MATLAGPSGAFSLIDAAGFFDPGGKLPLLVNMLSQANEWEREAVIKESTYAHGEPSSMATSLAQGTWRPANQGVFPAKSTAMGTVWSFGNLETPIEIDREVAELGGNQAMVRSQQVAMAMSGIGQQIASQLFYGNAYVNPERFTGFAPHYSTVNTATLASAANVIDAGGTDSDNCSIWVVAWGPNSCSLIYPKGSRAGLQHESLGLETKTFSDGSISRVYRDWLRWKLGLAIYDWRYVVRIANIKTGTAAGGLGSSTPPDLLTLLGYAVDQLPTGITPANMTTEVTNTGGDGAFKPMSGHRVAIYTNRTVRKYLRAQIQKRTNTLLTLEDNRRGAGHVMSYNGYPLRVVDALSNSEARVV